MRNHILPALAVAVLMIITAACESTDRMPSLIPIPEHIELRSGAFRLEPGDEVSVSDPADSELAGIAELAGRDVGMAAGFPVAVGERPVGEIHLVLDPEAAGESPASDSPLARDESYVLTSTTDGVEIRAATYAGLFYGTRTLLQLLPPTGGEPQTGVSIPALEIRDRPRFVYRGLHLDVGRHFFPPEFVKRYIDLLARHKLNVFHWHLTEDQGWRLEIDRYPRLTEVAAWREETVVDKNFDPYVGDGIRYGGFYTKEEVRDIVAYAARRFVTVIPEIEMPGHSVAALAAYPELACTKGPFEVSTVWGVREDIYCPHEVTFEFLEGVLTEVMELFPSPYIHIGGDEAPKLRWEESPAAQEVIRREGLADEHELQSWFIQRIERFLLEHGRRIIGWDEILEGGLAPQATVMSWRGVEGGIQAARLGHDVIMTPTSHMYFDYYQSDDREAEPLAIGGYLPLDLVYSFEPVPHELSPEEARHIIGAQGNVWTEYMKTSEHVEYMAYPRAMALAEVVWSPAEAHDWEGFGERLPAALARLDALDVNYRIPEPSGLADRLTLNDTVRVELGNPIAGGTVRYTLDGTDPSAESPAYEGALLLPVDTSGVTVSARVTRSGYRDGPVARASYARTILRTGLDIDSTRLRPGLDLHYFEGDFDSVAGVEDADPIHRGTVPRVELPDVGRAEGFALRLRGYLRVPFDDLYTFEVTSDDGSQLYINEVLVIDHDGYHAATPREGTVALAKGHHRFRVDYFQGGGGKDLALRVRRGQGELEPVPDEWFYVEDPLAPDVVLPMTDAP